MKTSLLLLAMSISAFTQTRNVLFGAENEGTANIMSMARNEYATIGNPSGLALADSTTVLSVSSQQYFNINTFNKYSIAGYASIRSARLGFVVHRFGNEIYNEQRASLAFAHKINTISLGITLNYHQLYAEAYDSKRAFSIDLGGSIKLSRQLELGTYITNLNQSRTTSSSTDIITTLMAVGLRYQIFKKLCFVSELEKYTYSPMNIKAGLRYNINRILILCTGVNTASQKLFLGAGMNSRKISFWCSYSYNYYLLSGIQLTLKYRFR